MRRVLVRDRPVHEVPGLVGGVHRSPAHCHVGVEVDAVGQLTPSVVAVEVPGAVEVREVEVAREAVVTAAARLVAHGEGVAARHDPGVSAEQHEVEPPVGPAVDDEVADLLLSVRAGLGGIDLLRRDHLGEDASGGPPRRQAVERRADRLVCDYQHAPLRRAVADGRPGAGSRRRSCFDGDLVRDELLHHARHRVVAERRHDQLGAGLPVAEPGSRKPHGFSRPEGVGSVNCGIRYRRGGLRGREYGRRRQGSDPPGSGHVGPLRRDGLDPGSAEARRDGHPLGVGRQIGASLVDSGVSEREDGDAALDACREGDRVGDGHLHRPGGDSHRKCCEEHGEGRDHCSPPPSLWSCGRERVVS
ncbi:MAG: hypothetical protein BWX47_02060 [candidate division Hyd24-12 bacterium ADurb.Bin004]|nr:MAG: hypothetical protein BWX47_02060 [candidate division Hyd24-12 bacterium ADurb.Bin004]